MARTVGKLNPKTIAGALPPGRHGDGGNLYLIVDSTGAKRWAFIFRWQGRQLEMGLGGLRDVGLAKARERAAAARSDLAEGRSPLDQKREAMQRPTFGEFAVEFLEAIRPGLSNPKHFAQWKMTLTTYAAPLKDKRLDQITTVDVVATLKPIWTRIPETADRTRQRIERLLDAEIDLATNVWTIPAARMKGRRTHRVPLSPRAREILDEIAKFSRGPHIFCVADGEKPLSAMAMTMLLRGLEDHFIDHDGERRAATTHGFRSTFRDWAGSLTDYPRELAEEALAHQIGNATERAYRRQDALDKRRVMMRDWANFISPGVNQAAETETSAIAA